MGKNGSCCEISIFYRIYFNWYMIHISVFSSNLMSNKMRYIHVVGFTTKSLIFQKSPNRIENIEGSYLQMNKAHDHLHHTFFVENIKNINSWMYFLERLLSFLDILYKKEEIYKSFRYVFMVVLFFIKGIYWIINIVNIVPFRAISFGNYSMVLIVSFHHGRPKHLLTLVFEQYVYSTVEACLTRNLQSWTI